MDTQLQTYFSGRAKFTSSSFYSMRHGHHSVLNGRVFKPQEPKSTRLFGFMITFYLLQERRVDESVIGGTTYFYLVNLSIMLEIFT